MRLDHEPANRWLKHTVLIEDAYEREVVRTGLNPVRKLELGLKSIDQGDVIAIHLSTRELGGLATRLEASSDIAQQGGFVSTLQAEDMATMANRIRGHLFSSQQR